jgi:hypothetical protein
MTGARVIDGHQLVDRVVPADAACNSEGCEQSHARAFRARARCDRIVVDCANRCGKRDGVGGRHERRFR